MKHQELTQLILNRRPRYNGRYKPLVERLSNKGDVTGRGDFSKFGTYYQTFMFAYVVGLRLGERVPLTKQDEKVDFAPISAWRPGPLRDFMLVTLLNRAERLEDSHWTWLSLEDSSREDVDNFVTVLVREMEAYANRGFAYLQEKWDREQYAFNSAFVFVDILRELPFRNKESLGPKPEE